MENVTKFRLLINQDLLTTTITLPFTSEKTCKVREFQFCKFFLQQKTIPMESPSKLGMMEIIRYSRFLRRQSSLSLDWQRRGTTFCQRRGNAEQFHSMNVLDSPSLRKILKIVQKNVCLSVCLLQYCCLQMKYKCAKKILKNMSVQERSLPK